MGYDNLIKQILAFVQLTNAEIEIIRSKFRSNKYKQKEYVLIAGEISTDIHFIVNGLVRVFYLNNGKETNTYLACDNGFVSSYSSFIHQGKSIENIQCIENTETLSISFKDMQELYSLISQWEKVGRILAEQNFLCVSDRLLKLQSIPAKEKYLKFLKTASDKIVQRTPLIHIASFLGMEPESLSRIRKSIS
ncbi:Crp/Fnr family transcriptional regulator [Flavobacterium rhamnosiphilum]|uniref:Crp/Fnr family transcriptional regulator n=1 Tax=Flavobacterium rhamnosiphilum TaxID=2541724 RepID=A0A4R5F946_9FLAO|nr:cyclic nucleotide-binding domain-containing protein [Flavobacterium rhamnosiphilum]TDE44915.1 Crp/Fnr family transcriptional regulator [Flavobacterium rhamnosiphilum]